MLLDLDCAFSQGMTSPWFIGGIAILGIPSTCPLKNIYISPPYFQYMYLHQIYLFIYHPRLVGAKSVRAALRHIGAVLILSRATELRLT
jgi:hypothetical protein